MQVVYGILACIGIVFVLALIAAFSPEKDDGKTNAEKLNESVDECRKAMKQNLKKNYISEDGGIDWPRNPGVFEVTFIDFEKEDVEISYFLNNEKILETHISSNDISISEDITRDFDKNFNNLVEIEKIEPIREYISINQTGRLLAVAVYIKEITKTVKIIYPFGETWNAGPCTGIGYPVSEIDVPINVCDSELTRLIKKDFKEKYPLYYDIGVRIKKIEKDNRWQNEERYRVTEFTFNEKEGIKRMKDKIKDVENETKNVVKQSGMFFETVDTLSEKARKIKKTNRLYEYEWKITDIKKRIEYHLNFEADSFGTAEFLMRNKCRELQLADKYGVFLDSPNFMITCKIKDVKSSE